MKKRIFLIQMGLLTLLISCAKPHEIQKQKVTCPQYSDYNTWYNWTSGPLCQSDTCIKYQSIWKELFQEKNNLSQNYFNNHIIPCYSKIETWDEGISFRIYYKVVIDWAVAYCGDHFIIKIKSGNILYPSLNLPRDIMFLKDDIRIAINNRAFSSSMLQLSNIETLQFSSNTAAMDKLISDSNLNTLCFQDIRIGPEGHMMVEAGAQYSNKENSCVEGDIDLINGKTTFNDVPCYYAAN